MMNDTKLPLNLPVLVSNYLNSSKIMKYMKIINSYIQHDTTIIKEIINLRKKKLNCLIIQCFLHDNIDDFNPFLNINMFIKLKCLLPLLKRTTYLYVSYRILGNILTSNLYSLEYVNGYGDCMEIILIKNKGEVSCEEIIFKRNCIDYLKINNNFNINEIIKKDIDKFISAKKYDNPLNKIIILDIYNKKKNLICLLSDHISNFEKEIIKETY